MAVPSSVEQADSLEHGRHAAARAADRFRGDLEERARAVAEAASTVLPVGGRVAGGVRIRLVRAQGGGAPDIESNGHQDKGCCQQQD